MWKVFYLLALVVICIISSSYSLFEPEYSIQRFQQYTNPDNVIVSILSKIRESEYIYKYFGAQNSNNDANSMLKPMFQLLLHLSKLAHHYTPFICSAHPKGTTDENFYLYESIMNFSDLELSDASKYFIRTDGEIFQSLEQYFMVLSKMRKNGSWFADKLKEHVKTITEEAAKQGVQMLLEKIEAVQSNSELHKNLIETYKFPHKVLQAMVDDLSKEVVQCETAVIACKAKVPLLIELKRKLQILIHLSLFVQKYLTIFPNIMNGTFMYYESVRNFTADEFREAGNYFVNKGDPRRNSLKYYFYSLAQHLSNMSKTNINRTTEMTLNEHTELDSVRLELFSGRLDSLALKGGVHKLVNLIENLILKVTEEEIKDPGEISATYEDHKILDVDVTET